MQGPARSRHTLARSVGATTPLVGMSAPAEVVAGPPAEGSRYLANNVAASAPLDAREARSKRFRLLDGLQRLTELPRLTHCRRDPHGQAEFIGIVQRDGLSSYSGLQTCGSVWACPIDSAKVRHERTLQLADVVMRHLAGGGGLCFPTLTLAHLKRDPLADTLGHLMEGWRYVQGQREWKRLRGELELEHGLKSVEITYGRNGWHPHLHGLQFSVAPLSDRDRERLHGVLWKHWNGYAEKNRLRVLVPARAVVVKRVEMQTNAGIAALAEYLFKVQDGYGIAAELVRADLKRGRVKASRVPFQIGESAVRGSRQDLALWHEYELATKGRRVLDWTKGAATALGLDKSDEELAAGDEGSDPLDLVADLTPYEWSLVVKYRRRGYLLGVADRESRAGVEAALRALRRRAMRDARKLALATARATSETN